MAEFNTDQIADLLGEGFQLKSQPNGNIQVQLSNLGNMSDLDKIEKLLKAARSIFDAGIIPENPETRAQIIRLSWPTGRKDPQTNKEIWVPYPQLWINQPSQAVEKAAENSEKVVALEQKVDSLHASIQNLVNAISAKAAPVANQSTAKAAPKKSRKASTSKAKLPTPPVAAPPEDHPPVMENEEVPPF